ncbi:MULTISPECIES: chemotaxis protein CheW [unclassified Sphingomonas]|uniref:chemotaxis protein CheW n=1 Tax=unclassified Sphingomonas TaxID=196159 RepID=UPI000700A43A|nr:MULTISPECIES: chemotaxis protein CheW [unclassified Sphingomonas]KQX23267.1 hypothetical protein ASD17_02795 [Sphingomonas sp. Root1294]KQY68115.1 hypothetical protein ASD39_05315 [Sphingomonas sp. Root50]KRB91007.1 hypothetical protein ASE22_12115 [Sphingomonas sp. Root720]
MAAPQLLALEVAGRRLGLPAIDVREVLKSRRLTPVPQAPPSLLGLCNLRGAAIPVLSLAVLLEQDARPARRIVVLEGASPIGLAVDQVLGLAPAGEAEALAVAPLIAAQFAGLASRSARRGERVAARRARSAARSETRMLSFDVAGQSYALPLERIEAVIPLGAQIATIPDADAAVIGTMAWRDSLLPLLSLAALLGCGGTRATGARIIVVRIEGHPAGLVVDAIGEVLAVPDESVDSVPALLQRGGGEARIAAIARLDGGKRLLSLLACDALVDPSLGARLRAVGTEEIRAEQRTEAATEALLLFTIGDAAYGLPLAAISEVARLPETLTALPRAPAFIRGVMHLRGRALAVVDQAARFGATATGQRLIVAAAGDLEAAFLVDRIRGVVRVPRAARSDAPAVGEEPQLFESLLTADGGPMTLLMSPFALLAQTERHLLAAVDLTGRSRRR